MKLKTLSALLLSGAVFFLASCGNESAEGEASGEECNPCAPAEDAAASGTYTVDTEASIINWNGDKKFVPDYGHNGTIALQEGTITVEEGAITGGSFVIDMSSIVNNDLKDSPEDQAKLVGHLKSPDFFDVETYPTATFKITSIEDGKVTGDLTMKDTTNTISFNADIKVGSDKITAKSEEFAIDRAKWNVKYGSTNFFELAQDNIISNEIMLTIKLTATKPVE